MECPCQENCPDGCPCPNYICENDDRFTPTEVLLIYQRPSESQPYPPNLINAPLSQVTEINFTWPRNINLYSACMANIKGEPHIFGGYPDAAHRSQVCPDWTVQSFLSEIGNMNLEIRGERLWCEKGT